VRTPGKFVSLESVWSQGHMGSDARPRFLAGRFAQKSHSRRFPLQWHGAERKTRKLTIEEEISWLRK